MKRVVVMSAQKISSLRRLVEAEGYLELGLPEEALVVLRKKPPLRPHQFAWDLLCGLALREQGQHEEALTHFESAARKNDSDVQLCLAMGWCLKRTGRLPRAIEVLRLAQKAHPEDALVRYNLACYYSLAGQKQPALHWLRSALDLEPEMRQLVVDESDFDTLRGDPDFEAVVEGPLIA